MAILSKSSWCGTVPVQGISYSIIFPHYLHFHAFRASKRVSRSTKTRHTCNTLPKQHFLQLQSLKLHASCSHGNALENIHLNRRLQPLPFENPYKSRGVVVSKRAKTQSSISKAILVALTHRNAAFDFIETDTGLTILHSSAPSCGMFGVFSVVMLQSCESATSCLFRTLSVVFSALVKCDWQ